MEGDTTSSSFNKIVTFLSYLVLFFKLFAPTLSFFSNFSVLLCPLFRTFLFYFTFLSYFSKINYGHPNHVRPIVSYEGSPTCNLASYFSNAISKNVIPQQFKVINSFELVHKLKKNKRFKRGSRACSQK